MYHLCVQNTNHNNQPPYNGGTDCYTRRNNKKVSLEHNLRFLTRNPARPQDKELDAQKLATHDMIMEADNKDHDKEEFSTFQTVLKKG